MNALFIAYYFPPDSSSGSFRPFHFANHLQKMGVQIYVLTARVQNFLSDQPTDLEMLGNVDCGIQIIRARVCRPREALLSVRNFLTRVGFAKRPQNALTDVNRAASHNASPPTRIQEFKDLVTDSLASPDPHIGWLPWAVFSGLRIIRQKEIDIVYSTGSPWTSFLIGAILKRLTGRPLVMDFRDPWVANPRFLVRTRFVRRIETIMERKVLKAADLVIANTQELKQDFVNRFPALLDDKIAVIPNGFENFNGEPQPTKNTALTLTHAGSLYFSRNPHRLIKAAMDLVRKGKIPQEELRIVFLGGISIDSPELQKLLQDPTVQDIVKIIPRVPFREAMEYQKRSDVLFLIQPDFPLQIPRKLYEYMALNKPILAITNSSGATSTLMREVKLGIQSRDTTKDIASALVSLHRGWKDGSLTRPNRPNCEYFLNKNLSDMLYKVLVRLKTQSDDLYSSLP
ncbi:MAG: glycosyltransferase [Desulfomonilaceae bacterium]